MRNKSIARKEMMLPFREKLLVAGRREPIKRLEYLVINFSRVRGLLKSRVTATRRALILKAQSHSFIH